MSMASHWHPAPAKLNLFLHVLGRRGDGYHLMQTVLRLIDIHDRIRIRITQDGKISRARPVPGVQEDQDLCLRAANALKSEARIRLGPAANPLGAHIDLDKRLPIGGGLGGGSSDAATVLLVLNRFWRLGLPRGELQRLALGLGADVPFFVFGANAVGEGIGERLSPLELPSAWYLILVPQVSVSTKKIFTDPALTHDSKPLKIPPFFAGLGRNDLEPVATARYPEIAAALSWLRKERTDARMTGSGACVFAQFDTEAQAHAVADRAPAELQAFVARGLDVHPLRDWAN